MDWIRAFKLHLSNLVLFRDSLFHFFPICYYRIYYLVNRTKNIKHDLLTDIQIERHLHYLTLHSQLKIFCFVGEMKVQVDSSNPLELLRRLLTGSTMKTVLPSTLVMMTNLVFLKLE